MLRRLRTAVTPLGVLDAVIVLAVIYVTIWELHPSLLVQSSLLTGGDTGSHLALPAYLKTQGNLFNLTPWYPGWFAGMPAYTYYFVLPDFFATLASYVISFAVAFKLATILGSVLMPITAYAMARLFRAPRPVPVALAVATLPFLFDASFTIDGGNLFSTMAGEYAFSLSLALSLLTLGFFAKGVRTGRGYWLSALALSLTLASHVLPWFFAIAGVGVLVVFELLARRGIGTPGEELIRGDYARPVRFAIGAGLLSLGLSAWWLLPFATSQNFTNSMGYTNDSVSSLHAIFRTLGWYNSSGGAAGDRWVIVLAGVAIMAAFFVRDRLGMVLATLTILSLGAFVFDPQGVIWNERLIPFWFLSIHLSAGWLFGYPLAQWALRQKKVEIDSEIFDHEEDELHVTSGLDGGTPAPDSTDDNVFDEAQFDVELAADDSDQRRIRRAIRATVIVAILGIGSVVPGLVSPVASALHLSTSGNQVTSWAAWNYSGYQNKSAWPEYSDVMTTMAKVAKKYGCGRAMWEYSADENRFGTPMALMLLPYWTNNCVDSMEGLFFESSATTPYHFLNQAELSAAPSNPQVGLSYGTLNVREGVRHLQLLGVRYYIAFSHSAIRQAHADPELHYVASTKHWPTPGVTWQVFLIRHSPIVQPLSALPNVVQGLTSRTSWLTANTWWWLHTSAWGTLAANDGPTNWPRASSIQSMRRPSTLPATSISHLVVGTQSVSFTVSRVGVPVLVKISYYPRWHVTGATGPYRVSPNLMVVVPSEHHVQLTYASTPALSWGNTISDVVTLTGLCAFWFTRRRRRHR